MVHDNVIRANEIIGNDLVKALKRRGFGAEYVATSEQALARVMEIIPADATVGIPGTITVRDIGALDALKARGNTVYQHWGKMSNEERRIINIDGTGNRVAGMAWGNGLVLFVVGINKLAFDLEDGLKRAKSATIPNAIRQNVETACVKAGHCVNCSAAGDDDSMCRAILILEEAVKGRKYHVIIVGEDLGY